MKKRLLSAALALAMVLTLLPVSAFAAPVMLALTNDDNGKYTVTYYDTATTASGNTEAHGVGWFRQYTDTADNKVKFEAVSSGVINSTGNSGTWYNSLSAALQAGATQVRLIDNQNLSWSDAKSSLTISLDNGTSGSTVTLSGNWNADMALTTLTIQGVVRNGVVQGQISNDLTTYKNGASITYKDVNFGSVYCQEFSNSAKVVLDNAHSTYTGIGLTGKPAANSTTSSGGQVEVKNGSEVKDITITHANGNGGTVSVTGGSKVTGKIEVSQTSGGSSTAPTVSVTGDSSVTGNITVTQTTGGYINVAGSTTPYGSKVTGNVVLDSDKDGYINLSHASVGGYVQLEGYNTTVNNKNSAISGETQIFGTSNVDEKDTKPPTVIMDGEYASSGRIIRPTGKGGSDAQTKAYSVTLSNNAKADGVELAIADITVNSATITHNVVLLNGTLTVNSGDRPASVAMGSPGTDKIKLGSTGDAYNMKLTVTGKNAKIGVIEEETGNTNYIELNLDPDASNYYRQITQATSSKMSIHRISGGTWGYVPNNDLLNEHILYAATRTGVGHSLYMINAIDTLVKDNENKPYDKIRVKGTTSTTPSTVQFTLKGDAKWPATDNGYEVENCLLKIEFQDETSFILPSVMNGKPVTIWAGTQYTTTGTAGSVSGTPVEDRGTGGQLTLTPNGHYIFRGDKNTYNLNTIDNVRTNNTGPNASVTPSWGDSAKSVIKLSGTYTTTGVNVARIPLVLDTDVDDVKVNVDVTFTPNVGGTGGSATFQNLTGAPAGSMSITDQGKSITLHNGKKYTLDVSGLHLKIDNLYLEGHTTDGAETVTTVNDPKQDAGANSALSKTMSQKKAVDFSKSPAVLQAFGAATNNITAAQVAQWQRTARMEAYQRDNKKSPSGSAAEIENLLARTGYSEVYAVLYMDVKVSTYGSGSSATDAITATMTPSWRIEVRYTGTNIADNPPIVIKSVGGSLGKIGDNVAVIGDSTATGVKVTLPVRTGFATTGTLYAHQDGNYVYNVTKADKLTEWNDPSDVAAKCPQFTITHTGSTTGLGTIVISTVEPPVTLYEKYNASTGKGDGKNLGTYDSAQKALDDAKNGNHIEVKGNADLTLNMTGKARKVTVRMLANGKLKPGASGTVTSDVNDGTLYTIQLDKDTVVKPAEKPIPITVASAVGGSASLSASRADEGDTITVTLVPATGYTAGGITVRTDTGANVSYTATGTNTYRFVVPTGAKSITVTPSFTRTNTGVLVTVASTTYGTATTTAGTNRVAVGSTVSVTVSPRSGYRTMGLYATSDTGVSATAYRTGVNTFTFTVPSATSSVVVTPRFDVNNGTVFEDVWSTEYYSAPVAWAVGRGITDGTDTYHFSPGQSCNRVQMVTFMWRAAGRPSTAGMANPFYDVSPSMGNDFYNAILWANAKGITNGDGSTTRFNPYKTVTRAEAVTFLWRYEGKPAASTNSGFYDVPAREWYAQAVTWAVGKGITNGDGSTVRFNPNGACLRAQIVTFLYRDITGARA